MRETDSSSPDIVAGREGDKSPILERLLASREEYVSIISIVGMGGLGKTTLAQLIFNDEKVKSHFELKMWVCVTDTFELKTIVKKILESATKRKPENDLWTENRENSDNLKILLMRGAMGMIKIGKEILEKFVVVPLAIKSIGSLLYFKDPETEWLHFMENELSTLVPQHENYILQALKLSYDHLPLHLKQCFAYFSLFPKDYNIKVETLIQMWIAQGFVSSPSSSQCLEDISCGYFKEFFWSSFFRDVEKGGRGNVESCKMHDLMHDLAKLMAGMETTILSKWKGEPIGEKTRHVSFHLDTHRPLMASSNILAQSKKSPHISSPN
ncbi:putative disease resistance protein RGA3 [Hevea brasiliensis]|uniref:putative disease resistance protein RGA3 n=1 Tax=Hevea brasiliensis TaxID=3981 RepID=UPI0025EEEF21|nr:putative disease resistance protein RGA3 [Hevea brasiliensis]